MKRSTTSSLFGLGSALAISATYIFRPVDPEYAGSVFSWNLTVFLPLFLLSCILAVFSAVHLFRFVRAEEKKPFLRVAVPVVLMLPCLAHVGLIGAVIIRIAFAT